MLNRKINKTLLWLLCVSSLAAIGCRGVKNNDDGGGGDGGITIGITDGPTEDADEVVITFTGVEVKPANDPAELIEFRNPEAIDLLEFQDGERFLLLDDFGLDDDTYSWIRLLIDTSNSASFIRVESIEHPLVLPSDFEDNLQLSRAFTVNEDTVIDLTIDFDLRKSIHQDGNNRYILRPSLRIVDQDDAVMIEGTVAQPLIDDPPCLDGDFQPEVGRVVYLFDGLDADIQDIQDVDGQDEPSPNNPIATAKVIRDPATLDHVFRFHFMEDGDYTAVFTCLAELDDPTNDDESILNFSDPVNISVVDGIHGDVLIE